jgi:hypothetical protein
MYQKKLPVVPVTPLYEFKVATSSLNHTLVIVLTSVQVDNTCLLSPASLQMPMTTVEDGLVFCSCGPKTQEKVASADEIIFTVLSVIILIVPLPSHTLGELI